MNINLVALSISTDAYADIFELQHFHKYFKFNLNLNFFLLFEKQRAILLTGLLFKYPQQTRVVAAAG